MMYLRLAACFLAALIAGCGGQVEVFFSTCDTERQAFVDRFGEPDRIIRTDADNNFRWTYFYASRGIGRSFSWGRNYTSCLVLDVAFAS